MKDLIITATELKEITRISDFIFNLAIKENDELLTLTSSQNPPNRTGLKMMPELAFSYLCGKEMYRYRNVLFNDECTWHREYKIGNQGPSDLVFLFKESNKRNSVIEFKLDDTWHSYLSDIKKQMEISSESWTKLFCSFKHVFIDYKAKVDQATEFLTILKEEFGNAVELVGSERVFPTVIRNPEKDHFLYTFWLIK